MLQRNPVNEDDRLTGHRFGFIIYPLMISGCLIKKKEGFLQWLQKHRHISVYIVLIALQTLLSNTLVLPPVLTAGRHRWLKCSEDRLQECDWNHGQALNNSGYWRWSIRCSSSKRKLSNSVAAFHLWKGQPPTEFTTTGISKRDVITQEAPTFTHNEEKSISANFTHENRLI